MTQVPLAPPPPTGGPLDSWLYLLWRRLTQAGQILWSSLLPGTSADVAAVVTDETGSPGSLVFSGNPTLQGLTVEDAAFTSRGITDNATATALTIDSNGDVGLGSPPIFGRRFLIAGSGTSVAFDFLRTDTPTNTQSICGIDAYAEDGSTEFAGGTINWRAAENWSSTNHGTDLQFRLVASGSGKTLTEVARIKHDGTAYFGGAESTPALKVTPVASQARWIEVTGATSSANPQLATTAGELLLPQNIVLPKTSGKGIQVDTASPSFGWRDLLGPIEIKSIGATDPVWTLYRGSIYAYTFDTATAEAFFTFHLPHDLLPSSASMLIHVHWSQIVVDTGGTAGVPGVAEWNFDITYADGHGTAGGAADPFIAPITVTVTQQASTTQYGHMIAEVEFANLGGTGGKLNTATMVVDGLLLVRMYRIKANPADTLNQAPFVHTVDIHYRSTNIGTKQNNPIDTGSFYV